MREEDIKKVDEWFDSHTEHFGTCHSFSTYRNDDEYSVGHSDLEAFSDFLRDEFPDLVSIVCFFGKGDSAIWFFREDLRNAQFL